MKREVITRAYILKDLIDEKENKLARLQCKACDPEKVNLDRIGGRKSGNLREDHLVDYLDHAAGIQRNIDRLKGELETLHGEILDELESCPDYYTRKMVIWRVIKGYSWELCAELSGYNPRTCADKYKKWEAKNVGP